MIIFEKFYNFKNLNLKPTKYQLSTLAGILAVLFWGSNVAFSKSVFKTEGNFNGAFYIYFCSGILNFIILLFAFGKKNFFGKLKSLSLKYFYTTAVFFVINNVLLFVAIGFTKTNNELLIVTIINYLWPSLIYIFKIPILKVKVKPLIFIFAIMSVLAGLFLVFFQEYSFGEIVEMFKFNDTNILAYLIALLAATSWAVYSNLIKKFETTDDIAAIPVVFIFSGLFFAFIQLISGKIETIDFSVIFTNYNLIFMILCPTSLGYLFWYFAMKHGNKNLVTSVSYFIPVISILIISSVNKFRVELFFWIGTILIITGAVLSYKSIKKT